MIIGILQFELLIHGSESLKDKRRVVRSVKDRLHREHQVSIAEVATQDSLNLATLGLALVGSDGRHVGEVLDQITAKLRKLPDAELGDTTRELLHGRAGGLSARPGDDPAVDTSDDDLDRDLLNQGLTALQRDVPPAEGRP
ncbi:MAG: DUF503 domain-containing protein [Phycisphaerae bacterium]|nr:DUF503 domain-containing protein [Phycisphaerae bacterium]